MLARSRPRKPPPISAGGLCSFIAHARPPARPCEPHGSPIPSPMLPRSAIPPAIAAPGVCLRSIAKAQPRSRKRGGRLRAFPGKSSEVRRLPGWASLVSVSGFFSSPPRCSFRPPAFHGQWAPSSRGLVSGAPCPPPFASRRQAPCRLA